MHLLCYSLCSLLLALAGAQRTTYEQGSIVNFNNEKCNQSWTYYDETSSACKCGVTLNGVVQLQCNKSTISSLKLQYCYCMTYDIDHDTTVVGYCPYSCITSVSGSYNDQSINQSQLNSNTCGGWNRRGQLCSECREEYGAPVYSYSVQCVKCSNDTSHKVKTLILFIARAFLPLTVMCVVITFFHINVLFPPWNMFVLACQFFSAPPLMQAIYSRALYSHNYMHIIGVGVVGAIYGPWNLDFFRGVYNPTCLSPRIRNIENAALDGLIGLYPLILLVLFYFVFKLHDCGCTAVVKLWRPFRSCLVRFRHRLDIQSSLIHAFSTFFLLSYTKLGIAAFYILIPNRVMTPEGTYSLYVYINPNIEYFQSSHLVYGIIALVLGTLFLVLPVVVLCLYHCHCFQRCLNHCHLRSLVLDAFVDAFQGCYKDGTNGTRDCRYFSVVHFLLRFKMLLLFGLTQDILVYAFLTTVLLICYVGLFVISQPYKEAVYNKTDMFILVPMLLFNVTSIFHEITFSTKYLMRMIQNACISLCICVPFIYFCVYMVIKWKRCCHMCTHNVYRRLHTPAHF